MDAVKYIADDACHVSNVLGELRDNLQKKRDNEVSIAHEVGSQYITDHNDRDAFKRLDRSVNQLARAWDRMIARLDKWIADAERIETSCDNFYGD